MELIAEGRTAQIFRLSDVRVFKLYAAAFSQPWVEAAAATAKFVAEAGVASPEVFDVVERDGRYGVEMEWIPGGTLFDALLADPLAAEELGASLAQLHASIHQLSIGGLAPRHPHIGKTIDQAPPLSPSERGAARRALEQLAAGASLLHGDLHPANVMITPDGHVLAIDWDGAMSGAPAADVARASFLLDSWAPAPGPWDLDKIEELRHGLHDAYLAEYLRVSGMPAEVVDAWRLPVAAGRLNEVIPSETHIVQAQVASLIDAGA